MGLLTKVIHTAGKRTKEFDDYLGMTRLYPKKTKRLVKKRFLFPKKIDGVQVSGVWIVEQKAKIDLSVGSNLSVIHYNKWDNVKTIEKYSPLKGLELYKKAYLKEINTN